MGLGLLGSISRWCIHMAGNLVLAFGGVLSQGSWFLSMSPSIPGMLALFDSMGSELQEHVSQEGKVEMHGVSMVYPWKSHNISSPYSIGRGSHEVLRFKGRRHRSHRSMDRVSQSHYEKRCGMRDIIATIFGKASLPQVFFRRGLVSFLLPR